MDNTTKISRGDVFLLPPRVTLYYTRTPEEVEALYEDDARRGDTMDSAGETRVHSTQGSIFLGQPATVMVTALRGAEWTGFSRRPPGLVVAVVTKGAHAGRVVAVPKRTLGASVRL